MFYSNYMKPVRIKAFCFQGQETADQADQADQRGSAAKTEAAKIRRIRVIGGLFALIF